MSRFQKHPETVIELVRATRELLKTIEAYDLEDELEAGEDGHGPVVSVRDTLAKFKEVRHEHSGRFDR